MGVSDTAEKGKFNFRSDYVSRNITRRQNTEADKEDVQSLKEKDTNINQKIANKILQVTINVSIEEPGLPRKAKAKPNESTTKTS
jgi:hypothetical protein